MMLWSLLIELLLAISIGILWMRKRERQLETHYQRRLKEEAQNSLRHANRLQAFLSAIQASPHGVVILDSEQRIKWCNQTAAQLLDLDAARDVEQHIVHLVRDPRFLEYMARKNFGYELRFDKKALQAHPYGEGRSLLLVRDVTDVERADQMRVDFVANVSHEIRTPLTVLAGFIETLKTLPLTQDEQARYLALMTVQSHRLEALVADLLILSKLDAQAKPALQRVNVQRLLVQCEYEARTLATTLKREIAITFDVEPHAEILGSESELQSAFSNLILNAVRYTPTAGAVIVTWRQDVFTVQDTGLGIAAEHLPRLTERFYRVDKSRIRGAGEIAGTGLGLAIVKHVAQRHGARLDIESAVGVGSVFRLVFNQ
jgi:two-component system phosphate regulon sensor histidine kinase PhoR